MLRLGIVELPVEAQEMPKKLSRAIKKTQHGVEQTLQEEELVNRHISLKTNAKKLCDCFRFAKYGVDGKSSQPYGKWTKTSDMGLVDFQINHQS